MLHATMNQALTVSLPRISFPKQRCDSDMYAPSFPLGSIHTKEQNPNNKVVVVMGATGTGKSKLAIHLARRLRGEVVNSDKIQMYDGLGVVTNKVTPQECLGIPHHLIGGVDPDADFTASDFRLQATKAVDSIIDRGLLPIIAGGSNTYIEELIDGAHGHFRSRYDCCFLWVDVQPRVLHDFVVERVDRMVDLGLVEEVRAIFDHNANYSRGIRRAIGVPELDAYFRSEGILQESDRDRLLEIAIDEIKANTCKLTSRQLKKIHRLGSLPGWTMHKLDATEVFRQKGEAVRQAWESLVAGPGTNITRRFLMEEKERLRDDKMVSNLTKVMEREFAARVGAPKSPEQNGCGSLHLRKNNREGHTQACGSL
ncbi:hypothetical protein LUZ60_011205 [Juncus effusus]|nr:hypothetical protein LUZ60_011205 [Juncus effusus]